MVSSIKSKEKKMRHVRNSSHFNTGKQASQRYKLFDDSISDDCNVGQNNDLDDVYINLNEIDKNISDIDPTTSVSISGTGTGES